MADSAEIVEPTSPASGAAGSGGSARSAQSARSARAAGPDQPAAASASIRLDKLTKRYPGSHAPAVEDVPRDEAAGETVIRVGPSVCGKSTTLKMISRLVERTSGQVTIGGEDVTGIKPVALRRTLGHAIQATGLFPHVTAHAAAGARLRTDGRHGADHGLAGGARRVAATSTRPGGGPMRLARVRAAVAGAGALLLAATGLSGCGLTSGSPLADSVRPGSIGKGRPLEGAQLTVTSKEFTEQIILGQIMGLVFKAAGAQVLDRTNIQGSIGAREAVKSGAADGMYEYTGTAWITYLGHTKPVVDPYEQWEAVRREDRRNGITWLPAAPLNNTYALVANEANAQKYRLRTLSDVARLTKRDPGAATICGGSEFSVRDDGLPGVAKTYGFALRRGNFKKMDDGVVYTQVAEGAACALGVAATTDGRIPELKLKVLEDDRHFFPNYNAAPEMNSATMRKYPALADLLTPITKRLTGAQAQRLNARVDVDGEDPHEVAKDWLVREGFIRED
ncbi:hypothetical protein JCM4914_01290 [Streptomyces platensis subsp. malvinus]